MPRKMLEGWKSRKEEKKKRQTVLQMNKKIQGG